MTAPPSHMLRPSCTTRSYAGSTIDARKERRRRTGVIDRSSVVAAILVPALLAAAAPPVVAQAPAQLQPSQLSLAEALRLALQQNQQLRVAAFEVAVARAQLAQSRAGGAIQGSVQGSYTRTQEGVSTTIPDSGGDVITIPPPSPHLYAARLILQYPLYSGGPIQPQNGMAEANLKRRAAPFAPGNPPLASTIRHAPHYVMPSPHRVD